MNIVSSGQANLRYYRTLIYDDSAQCSMARQRSSGSRSRNTRREHEPIEDDITPSTSLGRLPEWDERTLFFAPVHHISERVRQGTKPGRTRHHGSDYDGLGDLYRMYIARDLETRLLWESCGLATLFETSEAMVASSGGHHVVRALVEFF